MTDDTPSRYEIKKDTPWGRVIINYMATYKCSWNELARTVKVVHPWCRDFDAKRLREIVLDGAIPNLPEGLVLSYVCGIKNGFQFLPRMYELNGIPSAWSNQWDYLNLAKPLLDLAPSPDDTVVEVITAEQLLEADKPQEVKKDDGNQKKDQRLGQKRSRANVPRGRLRARIPGIGTHSRRKEPA
jgi:hypothetical protein